jgi:hypothetical protein
MADSVSTRFLLQFIIPVFALIMMSAPPAIPIEASGFATPIDASEFGSFATCGALKLNAGFSGYFLTRWGTSLKARRSRADTRALPQT